MREKRKVMRILSACLVFLLLTLFIATAAFPVAAAPADPAPENQSEAADPPAADPPDDDADADADSNTAWQDVADDVASIVDLLTNPLHFINVFQNFIIQKVIDFLSNVIPVITNNIHTTFFGNSFITALLGFFKWLAFILLTCGMVARIMRIQEAAHHGEPFHLGDILLDVIKSYGMILFCFPVIQFLNDLFMSSTDRIINLVANGEPAVGIVDVIMARPPELFGNMLLGIGLEIVTIIMLFRSMKRACTIFLQIVLGYLYSYDMMKGSNMISEWIRDVLAGYLTFAFQLMFYRVGLLLMTQGLRVSANLFQGSTLVGITLLVGVSVIPTALRKFGQPAPPGSFARGFGQAVSLGMSVARFAL